MANYILIDCIDSGTTYVVDFRNVTPNSGDTYYITDLVTGFNTACATVSEVTEDPVNYMLFAQTQSCIDCLETNFSFIFEDCNSSQKYEVSINSFGFIPQVGDVYNLIIKDRFRNSVSGCFKYVGLINNVTPDNDFYVNSFIGGPFVECQTCNNSIVNNYIIEQCGSGDNYVISITGSSLNIGDLVSFIPVSDPFEQQFCGYVVELTSNDSNSILISNFGREGCDVCLELTSVKREIINCFTEDILVVWASQLYQLGEYGFLQINDIEEGVSSCYEIGEITEEPVTVTSGYFNYIPSTSCQECIQCNGFNFIYSLCDESEITGVTFSNKYIQTGTTFFHPFSGCCEVIDYDLTNSFSPSENFGSFYTFENCESCSGDYETWSVNNCSGSLRLSVTLPSGYTSGDTVQIIIGETNYICVTLTDIITEPVESQYVISNETLYSGCDECNENLTFGLSIINCNTQEQKFVTVNFNDYQNGLNTFSLSNGECYFLFDDCVYNNTYPLINVIQRYGNCIECIESLPPVSAGTEYLVCNICEGPSGYTVNTIVPPHPVWTRPNGQQVTLLDAVALGGMFGLNN